MYILAKNKEKKGNQNEKTYLATVPKNTWDEVAEFPDQERQNTAAIFKGLPLIYQNISK